MSSRILSHTVKLVALAGLVVACGGRPGGGGRWGRGESDQKGEKAPEQAAAVVVDTVSRGPITAEISAASTIEAERAVTVHAEATGRILALAVEEGDKIKKGHRIARIKADMQASGLDRAQMSLAQAKQDYDRIKVLYGQGAASREELDQARVAYETAQIDVGDRRRDVRNAKVVAPFGGTVTERLVNEGSFVTSGQQLMSLVDFDTLVARVYIPEKELDRVKVGQKAEVIGKAAKGRKGVGTVSRIAPTVDATTGTVKVTVALPPELSGSEKGFLPGMYAEVTLTTETRDDALLVPKTALVHDDDVTYVYVADGHRARRTRVELGLRNREQAEVLEGLEENQEIIVVGQSGLKDDALIRRVDEEGNPLEPDPAEKAKGAEAKDDKELAATAEKLSGGA